MFLGGWKATVSLCCLALLLASNWLLWGVGIGQFGLVQIGFNLFVIALFGRLVMIEIWLFGFVQIHCGLFVIALFRLLVMIVHIMFEVGFGIV